MFISPPHCCSVAAHMECRPDWDKRSAAGKTEDYTPHPHWEVEAGMGKGLAVPKGKEPAVAGNRPLVVGGTP